MNSPDIFSYIKAEEAAYETEEVRVGDNWNWSMRRHIQMIFHLKNGIFFTGENNWLRAFKNIMEPILNLSYWSEDIELKDIIFFIEDSPGRVMSFLIKKYHDEVYVRENDLDTLLDEITESDLDYGGVLVQETNDARPEVLSLNSIAFCDQTDTLGGAIAFKHHFSPGKLRSMAKNGWGSEQNGATISIEDLITLADSDKSPDGMAKTKENKSTSKTIEIYIVKGQLPEHYLKDNDDMETYCEQVHVVAFYTDKEGSKHGVTLYRKEASEGSLKFFTSKKVHGRALGRGTGEALLGPQIWTNFLTIHKTNMLEAASKVPLYTDDAAYSNRNKIQDMENLEITTIEDGKRIYQVPTAAPANVQLYEKSINEWYEHGQLIGSAFDPLIGKEQASGTTFKGQERTVAQGKGLHDRRRGQRAKFIEQLYREIIIPKMKREILKGKKFLATLTAEEMEWVTDNLSTNYANRKIIDAVLDGKEPQTFEELKQEALTNIRKNGNQMLLEVLKDEFADVEIRMGINVAGKQKDLAGLSDKLLSIFQAVFANPQGFQQAMRIPGMSKSFNDILEFSGISQVDFAQIATMDLGQSPDGSQLNQQQPSQVPQLQLPQPVA